MKMTFAYTLQELQVGKYKSLVRQELLDALANGVRLWIMGALSVVPYWSGASWGTFNKLAQAVGIEKFNGVRRDNGRGLGEGGGEAQTRVRKTFFDNAYIVEYNTSLWHLVYNEHHDANANPEEGRLFARLRSPGPYDFQTRAATVFQIYAANVRLPNPWNSLKVTRKAV